MADTSADSSNASNPEGINAQPDSNSPNSPVMSRDSEPVSSSSGLIAPSRLGNRFKAKSPGPRGEGDSSDSNSSERSKQTPLLRPSAFNPSSSTDRSFGTPFGSRLFGKSDDASSSTDSGKKSFILRPSALDKHTAALSSPGAAATDKASSGAGFKTSFRLEPAKMVNPLAKKEDDGDSNCSTDVVLPGASTASSSSSTITEQQQQQQQPQQQQPVPDSTSPTALPATNPLFQQAIAEANSENSSDGSAAQSTNGGTFVFGENLADRVISAPAVSNTPEKNGTDEKEASKAEEKEMAEAALPPPADCTTPESSKESPVTLEQSAAAEQAKHNKPLPDEVEVITGEEDESNVFHLNTKLFVFDKETQSWLERGRGQLRLNDMTSDDDPNSFQSRLVMRTNGNLRVVLNTKIWPDMTIERASPKSIRITAFDTDNNIKVFLIMTGNKDADQIYSAIDWRIQQLRVSSKSDMAGGSGAAATGSSSSSSHIDLKRQRTTDQDDNDSCSTTPKKQRTDGTDESTVDPETEVSNESFGSSTREFSSDA